MRQETSTGTNTLFSDTGASWSSTRRGASMNRSIRSLGSILENRHGGKAALLTVDFPKEEVYTPTVNEVTEKADRWGYCFLPWRRTAPI